LWVSNGTSAGTSEISHKVDAADLTLFNSEVLFDSTALGGSSDLWVTNGTAAGTSDLGSISGANSGGLSPSYLTVFNNEVLFQGFDPAGNEGLWMTNGTAAGTSEIGGPGGSGRQHQRSRLHSLQRRGAVRG
jgi:ELWxxDGT repeat protein